MTRRPTTLVAALLIVAATGLFGAHAHAVGSWPGMVLGVVCAWTGALAVGLAAGRPWARELAALTFTALSVVIVPAAVAGVAGAPTAPPVGLAVTGAVLDVGVVALLCTARVTGELAAPEEPPADPHAAELAAFRAWLETVEPRDFAASRRR